MNAIDFSPLFRTAIGFDRLARLMDTARSGADAANRNPMTPFAGGSRLLHAVVLPVRAG